MGNLDIYEAVRAAPAEAQKPIKGGRLSGMTDISPMWRIKKLTELFGPCGIGWWYTITDKRILAGEGGTLMAAVDIELYYKYGEEISQPIPATGGSMLVAKEQKGLYTSDECFKMALTDAISVACKALGMGADIYWAKDRTKYDAPAEPAKPQTKDKAPNAPPATKTAEKGMSFVCADCGEVLKPYTAKNGEKVGVRELAGKTEARYGKILCRKCAAKLAAIEALKAAEAQQEQADEKPD